MTGRGRTVGDWLSGDYFDDVMERQRESVDRRIALTTRQMHQLREEFLKAAAPYIRIMADAWSLQPVRWIKRPDGHIDGPEIMWQPGWKETYDQAEQALNRIREEFEARAVSGR